MCPQSYDALYGFVRRSVFDAHVEGKLKAEIMANPEKFVRPDPELAQTLEDFKAAGKTMMVITNSDYEYTDRVMEHAFGTGWRGLFDIIIVNARKPSFWSGDGQLYQIVSSDGLMRPVSKLGSLATSTATLLGGQSASGNNNTRVFSGGSATVVQEALGVSGDEILYIGDHIYTDAALAKLQFSWRTCLILKELELEIEALAAGRAHRAYLKDLLDKKERIGFSFNQIRLQRQRLLGGSGSGYVSGEAGKTGRWGKRGRQRPVCPLSRACSCSFIISLTLRLPHSSSPSLVVSLTRRLPHSSSCSFVRPGERPRQQTSRSVSNA